MSGQDNSVYTFFTQCSNWFSLASAPVSAKDGDDSGDLESYHIPMLLRSTSDSNGENADHQKLLIAEFRPIAGIYRAINNVAYNDKTPAVKPATVPEKTAYKKELDSYSVRTHDAPATIPAEIKSIYCCKD